MKIEEFEAKIQKYLSKLSIELTKEQIQKFYKYMELLIEWNTKINLTAIVDPEEIILKHFVDSLTIEKNIPKGSSVADIGTGAGFPGIPLKIYREDIKVTLVDSLNKRINFLDEIIKEIELNNINTIHARAEEFGKNKKYRENFDIATSRAVANIATLSEYILPLVRVGGEAIYMKGSNIEEELEKGKNAIKILGGKIKQKNIFKLANEDIDRCIIVVNKCKNTPSKYPRKAGIPSRNPIV